MQTALSMVLGSSRHLEHGTRGLTTNHLREMGFRRSEANHNLYFLIGEVPLILVIYVDDLF